MFKLIAQVLHDCAEREYDLDGYENVIGTHQKHVQLKRLAFEFLRHHNGHVEDEFLENEMRLFIESFW